ncbi:MAG: Rho termination factor N-terminal domain-containing protein [Solirubrobacteraceae bacterium]
MSVLDRSALVESPLADLHAIASELSIDGYRRLRRADLITAILDRQGGTESVPPADPDDAPDPDPDPAPAPARSTRGRRPRKAEPETVETDAGQQPEKAEAEAEAEAEADDKDTTVASAGGDDDDDEGSGSRRRRGRRGGRGRSAARDEAEGDGDAPVKDDAAAKEDKPARRSRRPKGDADTAEPEADDSDSTGAADEEQVEGVVELLANGSGFVRVAPPDPSDEDVYISSAQVKRCELVSGDRIAGPKRAPRRSERFASLIRIETINGRPASELADSVRFDDLPAAMPSERLKVGSDDPTLKAIEWLTPFGKGSRVTIVGAARSGKSEALRRLARALADREELSLSVALAGVRPEEIPEWTSDPAHPITPAGAVSFAASEDVQNGVIEPVIDQARRLAARGADAVVLIDSLDGCSPSIARKALASARNIVDGGSVTVIATAAQPIGGETTVISLDVALASIGRFPALDLVASGTLRPELLVGDAGAEAIARTRAEVSEGDDD